MGGGGGEWGSGEREAVKLTVEGDHEDVFFGSDGTNFESEVWYNMM